MEKEERLRAASSRATGEQEELGRQQATMQRRVRELQDLLDEEKHRASLAKSAFEKEVRQGEG